MPNVDVNVINQLISDFIVQLNDEQKRNLIIGNAEIEYKEKYECKHNNSLKESVLKSTNIEEVEKTFEGMFKRGIISFCEFYKININKNDSKRILCQKIAAHFKV